MLREEKGTKRIGFESGECFDRVDLGGGFLGMKDTRDAKGEAEVAG